MLEGSIYQVRSNFLKNWEAHSASIKALLVIDNFIAEWNKQSRVTVDY